MDHADLMIFVDQQFAGCKHLLQKKRKHREGPTGADRLSQFNVASVVRNTNPSDAVGGMMIKHDTQLYAMIDEIKTLPMIQMKEWRETIYDSINYRLLLLATLEELGE